MPYTVIGSSGRIVTTINDSEAYQLAGAIDRTHDMEEVYYTDPDENKEQQAIYEATHSLFVKLRDANFGGYFRRDKTLEDFKNENPKAELVYLTEQSIKELATGLPVECESVILVPPVR